MSQKGYWQWYNLPTSLSSKAFSVSQYTFAFILSIFLNAPYKNSLLLPLITRLQFSSVTQSCLTLCDPMDCSRPGFPVLHRVPKLAQTHVLSRWCHPAILSSVVPLLLLPSIFPSLRVFSNALALRIRWPQVLELQFQHQSFQWIFRVGFL